MSHLDRYQSSTDISYTNPPGNDSVKFSRILVRFLVGKSDKLEISFPYICNVIRVLGYETEDYIILVLK